MRMAGYRRSTGGGGRHADGPQRLGLRERKDLRDLDRQSEDTYGHMTRSGARSKRSVWQLKRMADDSQGQLMREGTLAQSYTTGQTFQDTPSSKNKILEQICSFQKKMAKSGVISKILPQRKYQIKNPATVYSPRTK